MLKKLFAAVLAFIAAAAFAAVDVNKADQAALESVKGIGPAISGKILDERKKGPYKDWNDLIERVKGVGEGNAAKFSADGLTVNGAAFSGAAPAAKKAAAEKPAHAKKEAKAAKAEAAPATSTDTKSEANGEAKPAKGEKKAKPEKKAAAEKHAVAASAAKADKK